jgi:hypothetical protein
VSDLKALEPATESPAASPNEAPENGFVANPTDAKSPRPSEWRDALTIHPAAEMFPRMGADELAELGKDIATNGLQTAIVLFRENGKDQLLDGISRLDAIEAQGIDLVLTNGAFDRTLGLGRDNRTRVIINVDPYAFVASANLHRRHLTQEQKRELIAKLIKIAPEKSNRQIADMAKTSHHTVEAVRKKMESTGQSAQLSTRIGKDGRTRPTKKKTPAATTSVSAELAEPEMDAIRAKRAEHTIVNGNPPPPAEPKPGSEPVDREIIAGIQKLLAPIRAGLRLDVCKQAIAGMAEESNALCRIDVESSGGLA